MVRSLCSRAALRCCVWLACAALLPGSVAQAAEARGLGLNWVRLEGAEKCLSAAELMNRVETRAGRILFVRAGEALLSIEGYVRRVDDPQGWAVRLALSTPQGEVLGARDLGVLPGDECSVIDEAVEFLIHVTLDADGTLDVGMPLSAATRQVLDAAVGNEPIDPDPAQLPVAPRAASPVPRIERPAARPAGNAVVAPGVPGERNWATLDATGAAGLGQLPGVSLGVALHATLAARNGWLLEVGFASWPKVDARATGGRGVTGFQLQIGSLAVCPVQFVSALALCAGAEYGALNATPSGAVANGVSSSRAIFDFFGAAVLRVELGALFFLRAALTLAVPILRNDYVFAAAESTPRVFRTAPALGRLELGLGLRL